MVDFDELRTRRLANHGLGDTKFSTAPAAVAALCGVQSQDYAGAMWAVAQRTQNATRSDFADAFNRGEILRTHVLRPTWHFVAASDLEWMIELTGPRIERAISGHYRRLGLDERVFARTDAIIELALSGGNQFTKPELGEALRRAGVDVGDPVRLTHIALHAEAIGMICSGALRGTSQTWALVRDRVPAAKSAHPKNPARELAQRYFLSHGPATARDFAWWSGMTVRECDSAIAASGSALTSSSVGGSPFWSSSAECSASDLDGGARLLSSYDEYLVGYAERSSIFDPRDAARLDSRRNPLFVNTVVVSGKVIGTWKRFSDHGQTTARVELFESASRGVREAVEFAVQCYTAWAS